MSHKDQILVAELKQPRQNLALDVFSLALQSFIELKFENLKKSVKWVHAISDTQILVWICDASIARGLASYASGEEQLSLSIGEVTVDVVFEFIEDTTGIPAEFILVVARKESDANALSHEILSSLSTLSPAYSQNALYSRGDSVM